MCTPDLLPAETEFSPEGKRAPAGAQSGSAGNTKGDEPGLVHRFCALCAGVWKTLSDLQRGG